MEATRRVHGESSPAWYAVYTRHQHERSVSQVLTGKGFEVFLPQYRTVRQWNDRRKELMVPLFPNYVLLRGGLDRLLNILTTPGVYSMVSCGDRPAEIPAHEIDAIRRVVEGPLQVERYPFLKCGNHVRVIAGPLEGLEGILVRKVRGYRLVLSVEMLSKSAAVEVDACMVERVGQNPAPRGRDQTPLILPPETEASILRQW